jgi:uncharacterized protein YrrD
MADPVSWLLIERGWTVIDAEGEDVGKVEETVGDSTRDIFNGLTIATGFFSAARYVPAEHVGEITDGCVRLTLSRAEVERLPDYSEPPPSEQILPE